MQGRDGDTVRTLRSDPERALAGSEEATVSRTLRRWGHFDLLEEIGQGAFGRVYRAWNTRLACEVALKVIPVLDAASTRAEDLLREARLLAQIRDPHVVRVLDAERIGSEVGIWMELIQGRTLADCVRQDGPFGAQEASLIGISVCRALGAIHDKGLVHRDVKAQNVMREAGGRILLMDLGAGHEQQTLARAQAATLVGTPVYMAPELLAGRPATQASDIYSLGVLLFFLVTGKYPFDARTFNELVHAHTHGRRWLLADLRPDLPDDFLQVVDRAMQPEVGARYATAGALRRDLVELVPRPDLSGSERVPTRRPPSVDLSSSVTPATGGLPATTAVIIPRPLLVWGGAVAGVVLVVWLSGLVAWKAYDVTLGRSATGFVNNSPWDWWALGVAAWLAPVFYMTAMALAGAMAFFALRLVVRAVTPLSQAVATIQQRAMCLSAAALAWNVVAAQALALGYVNARFDRLLDAVMAFISTVEPGDLAPLHPSNVGEHILYGRILDGCMLASAIAWIAILHFARDRQQVVPRGAMAVGALLGTVSVLMLVAPYRIIWHNEAQRVTYRGSPCYAIGQQPTQVLLYCPVEPVPHNRVVSSNDPDLEPSALSESIFTPSRLR